MLIKFLNKDIIRNFFSLLSLFFILFISNFIVFKFSMSAMYDQIKKNNRTAVKNIIQSFDNCFKDIDNVFYSIESLNQNIYDTSSHKNLNPFYTNKLTEKLRKLMSSYDYIDELVLYFQNSELIITSGGTVDFDTFFQKQYYNRTYNTKYWRYYSNVKHPVVVLPSNNYTNKITSPNQVNQRLLAIIGSNYTTSFQMNVVIFIDEQKLLNAVNYQNMMEGTSLAILDENRKAILTMGENFSIDQTQDIPANLQKEIATQQGDFDYLTIKSEYNNYLYIHKVPRNYSFMVSVMRTNQMVLIISILCGLVIVAFFSIYIYRPMQKLLMFIRDEKDAKITDGFLYMRNRFTELCKTNEELQSVLSTINPAFNKDGLLKMIIGLNTETQFKDYLETAGYKSIFQRNHYVVILFHIFCNETENKKELYQPSQQMLSQSKKIEKMIEIPLKNDFSDSVSIMIENIKLLTLVGIDSKACHNQLIQSIQQIIQSLRKDLDDKYSIIAAVSEPYIEINDIHKAYQECKMIMLYRSVNVFNSTLTTDHRNHMYEMYFPTDLKDKIANYLLEGDSEQCLKIINNIIKENIQKNISYIHFKTLIARIFNSLADALVFCGYDSKALLNIEQRFIQELDFIVSYKKAQSFFENVVKEVKGKLVIQNKNKLNKSFIIEYINLHYPQNLYLENMAEILGTSPKYFSNFFKREFGINFVEYLNKVRIAHAKHYLKNTDLSIREIGNKIGYVNASTFASTFKKYCGVSPSKYKENYKRNMKKT